MEPEHLQGLNRGRLVAEGYCEGEAGDVPNGRGWDNGCLVQTIHLKKKSNEKRIRIDSNDEEVYNHSPFLCRASTNPAFFFILLLIMWFGRVSVVVLCLKHNSLKLCFLYIFITSELADCLETRFDPFTQSSIVSKSFVCVSKKRSSERDRLWTVEPRAVLAK